VLASFRRRGMVIPPPCSIWLQSAGLARPDHYRWNEWRANAAQAGHWQATKAAGKRTLPEPGDSHDDDE